jgi:50S ribosomal protein L16 3-hydroxylase
MLQDWLAPTSVDEFLEAHLGTAPHARPAAARGARAYFDWAVFDRILRVADDVLIAKDGRLVDAPAPRTLVEARALMDHELGIVVRKAERHDARMADLAGAFARDLPGEVHVQLYVTPAGTQTFGWHFDEEDVFIAQTQGIKDYYLRANTVAPLGKGTALDFRAVRRETSPLLLSRLIAGDWLYIPSRWWHLVRSVEDALSISVGVIPERRHSSTMTPSLAPSSPPHG